MARAKIFLVKTPNQGKNVFPYFFFFLVTAHVIQQLNSPHPLAYAIAKHQFKSGFIA